MIKRIIYTSLLIVAVKFTAAQQFYIDSLKHKAEITQNDTLKLILFENLNEAYTETNPDSAYYYAEKILMLARALKLRLNEVYALGQMGYALLNMGNYPRSLQTFLSGIAIAEDPKSEQNMLPAKYPLPEEISNRPITAHKLRLDLLARIHQYIGILYGNANNYEKEKFHYLKARKLAEQTGNRQLQSLINGTLGRVYLSLKKTDSALITEQKAYNLAMQVGYKKYIGSTLLNVARIHLSQGHKEQATEYFRRAIMASYEQNYLRGVVAGNLALADIFKQSGKIDSSLHYVNTGLQRAKELNSPNLLLRCYTALAAIYRTINNKDSTVKYQELIIKINDSLFNSKQVQQFQNIDFDEQQRQQEIEAAKKAYQNRLQVYLLLAGLAVILLIAFILWGNNRQRQKAFNLLQKQKKEIDTQREKVVQTLNELRSTQVQLIQQEKMASLGELTAGIAHEIQNPLNFVNNFSEVSVEMIDEMEKEFIAGNKEEGFTIISDLKQNVEKIIHHGKRADAIVKGMLQHSRSSSGQKELTNINTLANEYLRLSYHGLRAKDKSFNATIHTHFDESIGKINIIRQDIGRVLLNLYNNAFYSVMEKKKLTGNDYEPTVTVTTALIPRQLAGGGGAEIKVKDNGSGIPQRLIDKIFQPFFTTKPPGQGTGLGLSLSYDIIKAHGGELKVETKENEGAEFIINIPSK
jgi:signal transduction histidine kinase